MKKNNFNRTLKKRKKLFGGGKIIKINVKSYGVLGLNEEDVARGKTVEIHPDIVIVDSAGYDFINGNTTTGAAGVSGAIYRYIGLEKFPDKVRETLLNKSEGISKYHEYPATKERGLVNCIHVIAPDFTKNDTEPVKRLITAYLSVFKAFLNSKKSRLRLLPISGGVFTGKYKSEIPYFTKKAIITALEKLDANDLEEFRTGTGTK